MAETCNRFEEGTGQDVCAMCGQNLAAHVARYTVSTRASFEPRQGDEKAHCLTAARERLLASFTTDETTEEAEQNLADLIERERADAVAHMVPRSERERRLEAELAAAMAETEDPRGQRWLVTHDLAGRVKTIREASEHWAKMCRERAAERDAALALDVRRETKLLIADRLVKYLQRYMAADVDGRGLAKLDAAHEIAAAMDDYAKAGAQ